MSRELVKWEFNLVPADADKDTRYRLGKFRDWMTAQERKWHSPDLPAYRDHLLADYKPSTVSAHLSTIRAQYRRLARSNAVRDFLYSAVPEDRKTPADRDLWVSEVVIRLGNEADPANSPVKVVTSQDEPDSAHLRLTREQAEALMQTPGLDTAKGLRDTAVIALLLCTGIREAELCALDVDDLRQRYGGDLALHVREGKGRKERMVPYGELSWVLVIVDAWLQAAGIEGGAVFRGFYKGGRKLRPGHLSVRAIQYILADYPIAVDGRVVKVKPHDCRRTYARRQRDAGRDLVAIQQNLGHARQETTINYIGTLDASERRAAAVYSFNLNGLLKQGELL